MGSSKWCQWRSHNFPGCIMILMMGGRSETAGTKFLWLIGAAADDDPSTRSPPFWFFPSRIWWKISTFNFSQIAEKDVTSRSDVTPAACGSDSAKNKQQAHTSSCTWLPRRDCHHQSFCTGCWAHPSVSISINHAAAAAAASRHWVQHGASHLVLSPWGNRSNLQMMLTEQGHNALGKSQENQD